MANGKLWTEDEIKALDDCYRNNEDINELAKMINRTPSSCLAKANKIGITNKYIKKNNCKFTAIYQNYDWCFERYITKGMSVQEMAKEARCSVRVMQKWCAKKFNLTNSTFKTLKKLTPIQRQIVIAGSLGDGHIDKRKNQPVYIECHAENQKDYLFWKYSILKDFYKNPPKRVKENNKQICGVLVHSQPTWRMCSRVVMELKEIRDMSRIDKINKLDELGFSTWVLDDGYRCDIWKCCVAEWSDTEIQKLICKFNNEFGMNVVRCNYDNRYINFDADSSRKMDDVILRNIPNNLDIVQYKIINNDKIKKDGHYKYIKSKNEEIGVSTYCRQNKLPHKDYEAIRGYMLNNNLKVIEEPNLLHLLERWHNAS